MKVSRVRTLILLGIALGLPECPALGREPRNAAGKVTVAVVQAKSATIKQSYPCRVESQRYVHLYSAVEGRLAAILVNVGQAVKRGDPLLQLGPPGDAGKPEAKDRDGWIAVEAPCDGVLVRRSPIAPGDRVRKGTNLATLTDRGAVSVEFEVPERRYLALMTERDVDWRSLDLDLTLADHGQYPHAGKLIGALSSFHNETGDIRFQAEFPNPDGVLRPGQAGTLTINEVLKDAILIPRPALFEVQSLRVPARDERKDRPKKMVGKVPPDRPLVTDFKGLGENLGEKIEVRSGRYVYVVDKDHVAHRREVVIRNDPEDLFFVKGHLAPRREVFIQDDAEALLVVKEGIKAGDRIVVDGVERVRDGEKVE